jgi:hypothetical protein
MISSRSVSRSKSQPMRAAATTLSKDSITPFGRPVVPEV